MNKHEEILSKYETTLFNKNGQPVKAVTLINAGEALKEYGETLAARTEGDGWTKVEDGLPELTEPLMWWNDETNASEVCIENWKATVMAFDPELGIYKAEFSKNGWHEISSISTKGGVKPTHWRPLPSPPKTT
jgi:hypothetical protein